MQNPKCVPCKACGQLIFFARTQRGALMPMDNRAVVYKLDGTSPEGEPLLVPIADAWVSHFSTCKHSDQFSKRGTKTPGPTTEGQCRPPTSPRAS